jgi:phenylacetate-CoA ligase
LPIHETIIQALLDVLKRAHSIFSNRIALPLLELRHGSLFNTSLALRESAWQWSTDQKTAWILAALRRRLRHSYASTEYYREVWDRIGFNPNEDFGWKEFAYLPVLTREEVQRHGDLMRSRSVPKDHQTANSTGGSTGQPVRFWMGPEEKAWRASGQEFFMRRIGVPRGTRQALLWGHHLDPGARDTLRDRVLNLLANRKWYDCLRLSAQTLREYDLSLGRYQPVCIVAYPSALAALARYLADHGYNRPNYPLNCFVTGAEKLYADQRDIIERVFEKPVFERYGGRDVGGVAFQCKPFDGSSLEVDWAGVMLEPASEDSESSLLVTKLWADAMPMIRYANDDVGSFPAGSRPGYPTFEISSVVGRSVDRILLPSGAWVHGNHFPHLLKDFPLREFQIRQREDFSVTVYLVPSTNFAEGHVDAIMENLRANLPGISLQAELVPTTERTRANKWRPVVSDLAS